MKYMRAIQIRTSTIKNRSSGITVQTEISLLYRNQSDKGLHSCHSFLHIVVKPQYQANNSRARAGCACSRYGMEIVRFGGGGGGAFV